MYGYGYWLAFMSMRLIIGRNFLLVKTNLTYGNGSMEHILNFEYYDKFEITYQVVQNNLLLNFEIDFQFFSMSELWFFVHLEQSWDFTLNGNKF